MKERLRFPYNQHSQHNVNNTDNNDIKECMEYRVLESEFNNKHNAHIQCQSLWQNTKEGEDVEEAETVYIL